MKYSECREQLRIILDSTNPRDHVDAIDTLQKIATVYSLILWSTRKSAEAREQFSVFASYYEKYALGKDGIGLMACEGELTKLIAHLPDDEE